MIPLAWLAVASVPPVTDLVTQGHDLQPRSSAFYATLTAIAHANHWEADADRYQSDSVMSHFERGRAVTAGNDVLVVLESPGLGEWGAVELLLLGPNGKLLDKVGCDMNGRYGTLDVNTAHPMEAAIRFVPPDPDDSYMSHTIAAHGRSYKFHTNNYLHAEAVGAPKILDGDNPIELSHVEVDFQYRKSRPEVWSRKGLLHVTVANDKLAIPFPDLAPFDRELGDGPPPSVDELAPNVQAIANQLLPAWTALQTESGDDFALAFELKADGSIAGLKTTQDAYYPTVAAALLRAVRSAAFAPLPVAVPEHVDVTVHFERRRFKDGRTEVGAVAQDTWTGYFATVEQRVLASWRSSESGRQASGGIALWVNPAGTTLDVKPARPWADAAGAAAAVAAIKRTAFPPLPWHAELPLGIVIELVPDREHGQQVHMRWNDESPRR
jgi:hypothetical protein